MTAVYQYTVQQADIIRDAMLNIKKLGEDENPTAQEYADCSMKLSMLLQQFGGKRDFSNGIKMWQRRRSALFLSNTTQFYNVGPTGDNWTDQYSSTSLTKSASSGDLSITVEDSSKIFSGYFIGVQLDSGDLFWTTGSPSGLNISISDQIPSSASSGAIVFSYQSKAQRPDALELCILLDIEGNSVPVTFMTVQDIYNLPNVYNTQVQGDIGAIYYESRLNNGVIQTNVCPQDVTKVLVVGYLRPTQVLQNPTDVLQMPGEWSRYICWSLSKEIAPMFSAAWTEDMQSNYLEAKAIAQEGDPETTTLYFQPGNDGNSGVWG